VLIRDGRACYRKPGLRFFSIVIFVVGLPAKLIQYLLGHPDAAKGWHLFPLAIEVLLAGAVLFGIGLLIERWHRRVSGGTESHPDYIAEIGV
jgi:hypothetical protein